jgi:hypothetical protein
MRRLLVALSLVVTALGLGGVANALPDSDGGAYCAPGSVHGSGSWTPSLTTTLEPHSVGLNVTAQCTGAGDDAGFYELTLSGASEENCGAGDGGGTISGGGPDGAIAGSYQYYRAGVHLYLTGNYASGGENHVLHLWLDAVPFLNDGLPACNYGSASLIGHGAVADEDVATVTVAVGDCVFSGSTTQLTPIPVTGANSGTWALSGTATCAAGNLSLTANGSYSNVQCGTGTAAGTVRYGARTRTVAITFAGFVGAMTFSDGGVGMVVVIPETGGCVTHPAISFSAAGWFSG